MGDVLEELNFRALNLATASLDRAERRDFGARSLHATRAGAKRLRALWQLQRPAIDEAVVRQANRRLRDSNRLLALARDAHVARKTTEKLLARCGSDKRGHGKRGHKKDRKALRALRDTLPAESKRGPALDVLGLAAVYREELASWRSLVIENSCQGADGSRQAADGSCQGADGSCQGADGSRQAADGSSQAADGSDQAVIYGGIRRAFATGEKLAREAIASRRPSDYHRWRKWVKYLLYQLEALDPRLLGWQRDYTLLLDRLGDELGKYNDLESLRERAMSGDLSRRTRQRVCALIDARARRARRRSEKLRVDVYRARPEIFAASIARAVTAPERMAPSLVNIAGD